MDDNGPSYGEYEEMYGLCESAWAGDESLPSIDTLWTTKDGRRVAIKDMTDLHLLNAIRVLANLSPHGTTYRVDDVTRRRLVDVMANEAYRRGLTLHQECMDGQESEDAAARSR